MTYFLKITLNAGMAAILPISLREMGQNVTVGEEEKEIKSDIAKGYPYVTVAATAVLRHYHPCALLLYSVPFLWQVLGRVRFLHFPLLLPSPIRAGLESSQASKH